MATAYILAGINHLWKPGFYLRLMPSCLPWHRQLVVLSGLAEIALGTALFFPLSREWAAWGIILLLVAIFPANVEQLRSKKARLKLPLWAVWLRLPLQLVLIWWAWLYT